MSAQAASCSMLKEPWKPFKQANHWAILGARDPSSNEPSGESLEMAPRKQAGGTAKLHGSAWRAAADRAGSHWSRGITVPSWEPWRIWVVVAGRLSAMVRLGLARTASNESTL